jgi:hypothetical protein
MKNICLLFSILFILCIGTGSARSQGNNVLLEFCTGTWCGYCPCGHEIAEQIQTARPNTLVLGYHGIHSNPQGDPWVNFNGWQVIDLLGMTAYPTGVVGRRTGVIDRGAWTMMVNLQSSLSAPVSISVSKTYNPLTRVLNATIQSTALQNLVGNYNISYVIYENNIIYQQTSYSGCPPGGPNYVHKWVVRSMINGPAGEALNTGGSWSLGQTITKTVSATLDTSWVASNCDFAVIVFLSSGSLSTTSYVQQTQKQPVIPVGIKSNGNETPLKFSLSQNYPNPFNPVTNIKFSVPENKTVALKIYDVLGNEKAVLWDGLLKVGIYNAEFDGTNFSSGVYFFRLSTDNFSDTKKMILMK